jgi:hypothetical protein
MKKTDIERILKQGSVRQKIKLYMTDSALFNVELHTFNIEAKEDEGLSIKSPLLTDTERDFLWRSIKEPKDIKYYEKLRTLNSVFLYFKDKLSIENIKLGAAMFFLHSYVSEYTANAKNAEVINDLLELYPDKKSKEAAHKLALEKTKDWRGKVYQEINFPKYIEIAVNKNAKIAKEYITMFKLILSKELPIQPYKDWVKKEEDITIDTLNKIYDITSGGKSGGSGILKYNEIEVEITQEDVEDFKSSKL